MVIILVIVVGIILIAVGISGSSTKTSGDSQWEQVHRHLDGSWREDNGPGSFTIYDKKGAITVTKTYEGGDRYIDGHKCSTADDMTRWYIKKGLAEGFERRLHEIEHQLSRLNTDIGDNLLSEWKTRYDQYRQLCIKHGFWNWIIEDRSTFIPTSSQEAKEKEKIRQVEQLHAEWKQRMVENRIVLDYLEKCPRKHALKNTLVSDLTKGDPEKRKQVLAIYRRLKAAEVIGEKQNADKKAEARIIVRRSKGEKTVKPLPASTYDPNRFANIRMADVYKVDYTIQEPQNLDREANTCTFVSMSSGVVYSTSLERCTCPAYYPGGACKHMLALAMRLGYYHRYTAKP